jgi:hypothetical protein
VAREEAASVGVSASAVDGAAHDDQLVPISQRCGATSGVDVDVVTGVSHPVGHACGYPGGRAVSAGVDYEHVRHSSL